MKNRIIYPIVLILTAFLGVTQGATITVNTADNADFGAGKTNLVYALTNINDGDTIAFNISGAGPHHLITPVNGYPLITKNNLVIDGYTQPGSSPNSNPMLAANNAVLKIVLDSQNGEGTSNAGPGFGAGETGVLFLMGTNCHVRGMCFLGAGNTAGADDKAAIDIGNTAHDTHVSGCWIGVDVDGTTLHAFDRGPTAFGDVVDGVPSWPIGTVIGVKAGPADTAAARAQQNVIVGGWVNIFLESMNMVIAGNKLNVLPDGLHDVDQVVAPLEAVIESGRVNNNMRVGTDGNGLNDAEERNVFGGVSSAGDDNIIEIYGQNGDVGRCTNIVIAGNYFGVAVDGVTRFTNSMMIVDHFTRTVSGVPSDCQFGSDFDGVSDDIEANVIFMNNPFTTIFPDPSLAVVPKFCNLTAEGRLSLRGNKLVNNNLVPFSYADALGGQLNAFTNYSIPYMDPATNSIIPTLAPTSIYPHLQGTFALGTNGYTNIVIDVYQLDQEGWNNGKTIAGAGNWSELTDSASYTNGFAQGSRYLGSRVVPNTGSFDINIAGMDLGPGQVTVTVNYSADPAGTHNGRVHTSNFSELGTLLPGSAESVGLTHIVNDVALWYDNANSRVTNGFVNLATQLGTLANWEPYIDVLGDSTFLVGFNTYADDQTPPPNATIAAGAPFQRFAVALQPAAGGAAKIGEHFYTDAGAPYRGVVNYRRQNGNPERVAGDKRFGAANFITAAETSLGQDNPAFQSDTRWTSNVCYVGANAYVTVQTFSLNPATLTQTLLAKAFDPIYGNFVTATAPNQQTQVSRTGGRPVALDNGNFVVVSDDRTAYLDPDNEVSTFSIITPSGAVVKSATLVSTGDQWDNVAAFRGGFAVRPAGTLLYFYNNAGTLQGSVDFNASSGLSFDTGRGDGLRTASDIRSHYVYMASRSPNAGNSGPVWLAVWDANTQAFVGKAQVDDQSVGFLNDRVSLAVDALNRVCVAYAQKPTLDFQAYQVVARVLSFDGANFTYLTHSFFPFVNYDPDGTLGPIGDLITTVGPSVAMTTRQICIAAKATINSTNNPAGGGDTFAETTVYAVISHPAPVAAPRPAITITRSGGNLTFSWNADDGLFTLQSSPAASPTAWADVVPQPANVQVGSQNTKTVPVGTGNLFFRLMR